MDDLLQQGIQAYKSGDLQTARKILINAVKQYPNSEQAWGWMYNVCNTDQERIYCLNQVLRINPSNEKARQLLNKHTAPDFPFEVESTLSTEEHQMSSSRREPSARRLPVVSLGDVGEYVKSILLPNEQVLAVAKIHWIIYLTPAIFGLLAISGTLFSLIPTLGVSSFLSSSETATMGGIYFAVCGLPFWVIAGIGIIRAFLITKFTEFALTDKRVIGKAGIIKRTSLELVLGKVESLRVTQSFFGRLFNYGTLIISGSGGTHQPIPFIAEPMKMKQAINLVLSE